PQLDAIRTFAVVPVMVHHLWSDESRLAIEGVKLFFVISGFLITQILLSAREGAGEAWRPRHRAVLRFYGRRVVRIFPLYYGVILGALALGLPPTRELLGWLLTYLLNFKIAAQGEMVARFSHFWSLCVEEQFYLVWPWVIFLLPRRWLPSAASLLIAGAIAFRLLYTATRFQLTSGVGTYVLPFASLDSLGLGALLAIAASRWAAAEIGGGLRPATLAGSWLLLILLLARDTNAGGWTAFIVQDTLESVLFCAVIWAAVRGVGGVMGRVLSARPLVYLGKISYGLY